MNVDADKPADAGLRGTRVFIVEDESLIAMLLEDILEDIGCAIVGSALTLRQAMDQAATVPADIAILDINLGGDPVFPVATRLAERGVAIVFASGYGASTLPEDWRHRPTLPKPFSSDQVMAVLNQALNPASA